MGKNRNASSLKYFTMRMVPVIVSDVIDVWMMRARMCENMYVKIEGL
jgi:hypothetical protein